MGMQAHLPMMKLPLRFVLIGLLSFAAEVPSGRAIPEAEATAGRLALRNLADAVVSVKLSVMIKASINGRDLPPRETNVDVNATVITAEGLTVTSLAAVDPKMAYDALRQQMAQNGLPTDLIGT